MGIPIYVLIIENSEGDAISITRELQRGGYDPTFERVDTPAAFSTALAGRAWDIVIAGYSAPRLGGLDALTMLKESGLDVPLILLFDTVNEDATTAAIDAGVHDCIMKDTLACLNIAVRREMRKADVRLARRQAEERLWFLSSAVEQSSEGIAIADLEGNLLFVNDAFAAMHGYDTPQELAGKHLSIFHTSEQMPAVEAANRQIRETGEFSGEIWHVRRDGAVFPTLMHNSLLRDDAGNPVGLIGTLRDITARKRVEEDLRRLKEFNENIIQSMAEGIVVEDVEGYFTFVNPAAAALLGYDADELVGQHWTRIVPLDQQHIVQEADERRARGESDRYALQAVRKDGARVSILISGSPRFEEGRFVGTLAVFTDITRLKRVEEALEIRVEQLAALSRASQAVAASLELDQVLAEIVSLASEVVAVDYTSVVLVNEAGHVGQSAENISGIPAIEYRIRKDGLTDWIVHSRQAIVIDEIGDDGVINLDLDGGAPRTVNPLIMEANVKSIAGLPLLVKGRPLGVLYLHSLDAGAFSDQLPLLTAFANQAVIAIENARLFQAEQRQAQRLALLADVARIAATTLDADELLQTVADTIRRHFEYPMVGIFTLDEDGQAFTMRGYSGISIGRPALTTPGAYRQPIGQGILGQVARTGKPYLAPDVSTDPHFFNPGKAPTRSVLHVPILDEGYVVGAVSVESDKPADFDEEDQSLLEAVAATVIVGLRNIRLHNEAQERGDELAAALARQEKLDRLKDEFIQNVSHELRSPLALVRGYAEILGSGELGELQPEQKKPLAIIARRARMLGDLVQDITLIMEAEANAPDPEPVPLDELAQAAVEDFQVAAEQTELTLHTEIASHLPPVRGSYNYMRRVLDNLLGNAIKFTPEEGTITVRVSREGERIALEVSDTGAGIPPDQQEHIFERFYQVDGSASRRHGGVGLGLALVKEIVEAYGGSVTVKSQVGKGSTFTVRLPIFAD